MLLSRTAPRRVCLRPTGDVTRKTRSPNKRRVYITRERCRIFSTKRCILQIREREVQEQGDLQEFVAHVAGAIRFAPVR